jgi:lipopolysaccharide/colanic/teichoic acid biosynthesis glycosyltransferase
MTSLVQCCAEEAQPPHARRWLALLSRSRVQLLGGLLLAVGLPALPAGDALSANAMLGSTAALVLGYGVLRRLSTFPGVDPRTYATPVLALTYGLAAAAMLGVGLGFRQQQLVAGFGLGSAWFFAVQFVTRERLRRRLVVVPGERAFDMGALKGVDVVPLHEPDPSRLRADAIIADFQEGLPREWETFIARAVVEGYPVYHAKQVVESLTGKVEIGTLADNTFGSVLPMLAYAKLKRLIDLAGVAVLAPVFLPVIAVAALLIKLDSPGPVFFSQKRVGYRGRCFTIHKLRTMHVGAQAQSHFTCAGDPRITRIGAFLRKVRIDEFPQIWNIAKGEMSWIGPRPEAVALAQGYEQAIPFYAFRQVLRPGISGWAQINQGNVGELSEEAEKIQFDFYYIKHFSPWLDALIAAKTIGTMLTGFGAR